MLVLRFSIRIVCLTLLVILTGCSKKPSFGDSGVESEFYSDSDGYVASDSEPDMGSETETESDPSAPSASSTDSVSLTDTAARLQKLENTISALPVVDSQRVEDIRSAIANGEYQIDAESIADKMMSYDAEFNG